MKNIIPSSVNGKCCCFGTPTPEEYLHCSYSSNIPPPEIIELKIPDEILDTKDVSKEISIQFDPTTITTESPCVPTNETVFKRKFRYFLEVIKNDKLLS